MIKKENFEKKGQIEILKAEKRKSLSIKRVQGRRGSTY